MSVTSPEWSNDAAAHLLPQPVTPFTWSNFKENAEWAYHQFYNSLGVEVPYSTPFWQLDAGQASLNAALISSLNQKLFAGPPEALGYGLGDTVAAPTVSERLGLFQGGSKPQRSLQETATAAATRFGRVASWWQKVRTLTWAQAPLLQVMEEIEGLTRDLLLLHVSTQAALTGYYLGLGTLLQKAWPNAPAGTLNLLFSGLGDLPSAEAGRQLWALAQGAGREPDSLQLLQGGDWSEWQSAVEGTVFGQSFNAFLEMFGHRSLNELEAAQAHWGEQPKILLGLLAHLLSSGNILPSAADVAQRRQATEAEARSHFGLLQRRGFDAALAEGQRWLRLHDQARNHLAMLAAGTRIWVLAAGRDGAKDGRLASAEDVFFLEMEEVKQMLTGEFNRPEQIRPLVETHRAEYTSSQSSRSAIGKSGGQGFGSYPGQVSGPAHRTQDLTSLPPAYAVLVLPSPDPGFGPAMLPASAVVCPTGNPLSPAALIAREYGLPGVFGSSELAVGQNLTVNGDNGTVKP